MILHPGGSAQAMLTWRVNMGTATPFNPDRAKITPLDEYTSLWTNWQGGPVLGGNITAWPLRAAPAGPFPASTGMDVTGPKAGATVKVAACTGTGTQKWGIGQVSYNDFGGIFNTGTGNVLTDPAGSAVNGTKPVMGPYNGDLSYPWRVSFHHDMSG